MSDIENISEQLSAYLDGELTQSQARRVAAALAENPELTAELEELRKTRSFLRDLPRRCAGDDFAANVLQEANRRGLVGRSSVPVRRRGPARWLRYCAAAAIVLVALGAGVVVSLSLYDKMGRSPVVIRDKELIAADTRKIGEVAREFKKEAPTARTADKITDSDVTEKAFAMKMKKPAPVSEEVAARDSIAADTSGEIIRGKGALPAGPTAAGRGSGETYAAGRPRRSKRPGAPPPVRLRKGPSKARGEFLELDEARTQPIDELASLTRKVNNETIFTDNMKTEQKNVEKILISNGFEIAPRKQPTAVTNQAINLNNNLEYNRRLNRAPVPEDVQVEYLVVGDQEQLNRLRRELQTAVIARQRVSQLPEPFYHRALRGGKAQDAVMGFAVAPAEPESMAPRGAQKGVISTGQVAQTQPKPLAEPEARQVKERLDRKVGQTLQDRRQQPRGSAAPPCWVKGKTREDRLQQPQIPQQTETHHWVAMLITLNYRRPLALNRMQAEALKQAEAELGTKLRLRTETKKDEPAK